MWGRVSLDLYRLQGKLLLLLHGVRMKEWIPYPRAGLRVSLQITEWKLQVESIFNENNAKSAFYSTSSPTRPGSKTVISLRGERTFTPRKKNSHPLGRAFFFLRPQRSESHYKGVTEVLFSKANHQDNDRFTFEAWSDFFDLRCTTTKRHSSKGLSSKWSARVHRPVLYTICELAKELKKMSTHNTGTVNTNRKGLPDDVCHIR